ncbi:MAG: flagellar M-ring protein FliF C-terminal domain-containing protein [Planctomycetota bacterium]|jgi:flagellar biosynthesis/type III secretory pathway M-ring protein FliF/YscJ
MRRLLEYVSKQLGVLTLSQRLALGLSAALIVVSVLWLLQWSSKPDMVPLVNHKFTFDELETLEEAIKQSGLPYKVAGMRIYVREADRYNLVRVVHAADALPDGSLYDMTNVVEDPNPFEDPSSRRFKQDYAKGNELAKIIATAPYVQEARVVINNQEKRRLDGMGYEATATVSVKLVKSRSMTQGMVEGFARLVAHAIAGLKPHNVAVIDLRSLRSYSVPHPDEAGSLDFLSKATDFERSFEKKIRTILTHIPGVQVGVTVDLDTSKSIKELAVYDSPSPRSELMDASEQSLSQQPTGPGVQPNLGQAVMVDPSGGRSTKEKTDTENFPPNMIERERIEQPALSIKRVTATIAIPRSFVVGVYKAQHPDMETAIGDDNEGFVALRNRQVAAVQDSVQNVIQGERDDVKVEIYPDMEWTGADGGFAGAPGGVAGTTSRVETWDAMRLLDAYGRQAGMGLLALLSLGMMMRVVRKSTDELSPKVEEDRSEPREEVIFDAEPPPIGEAGSVSSFLVGREVNDDVLRVQEITNEVTKMVEEDPGAAAELLTRWINDEY